MHHIKKKCSCQSPVFTSGGPEIFYDQRLCGCHELDSNQHLWEQKTGPANYHSFYSDRDFVYPVPLAAKGYIRGRSHGLTLLVDQLQSWFDATKTISLCPSKDLEML